jgi:zinc/manganese transport system substrate-binding protein
MLFLLADGIAQHAGFAARWELACRRFASILALYACWYMLYYNIYQIRGRQPMKKYALAILIAAIGLCSPALAANKPLRVVASFSILADMAQNIGGDAVEVKALVGPDSDTHTYQPTPEDAKALADADLVLVNGLGFEGWIQRLIEASGYRGMIAMASKGVKTRTMVGEGEPQTASPKEKTDPHAWQDLANGRIYAKNIAAALEQAMPAEADAIHERAAIYDAALGKMDSYVREQFADIPAAQRKIITSHDAFGYFGAAYGIAFLAPVGVSTEAEPSASDVARLIEQIKAERVKQVFIENMTNAKLIEQIGKDTGARIGGTLYADALSAANGPAPTYLDMFRNNAPKFRAAMLLNRP